MARVAVDIGFHGRMLDVWAALAARGSLTRRGKQPNEMDLNNQLNLARSAAREAGALLAGLAAGTKTILSAEGRDIKLQADRDAEALILARLQGGSPHAVLAEESGEHGAPSDGAFWVVDPLDGTMNFARALPLCCVSIALMQGERPLLGVIYDFNSDELFSGAVGLGAWLNDTPMSVSTLTDPARGVLATGFPLNCSLESASLAPFILSLQSFKKVRMLGTAALMMAWLAAGRLDAYAERDVMLWDVAAGLALIEAAGGWIEIGPSSRLKWARCIRAAATPQIWQAVDARTAV